MRVFYQRLMNMSLRNKLLLSLLAFMIFPLILIMAFINYTALNIIENKTNQATMQSLHQAQVNIDSNLNETEALSTVLLADDNVQKMGRAYYEGNSLTLEENKLNLTFTIKYLLDSKDYINSVAFSSDKEILFQYGDEVFEENMQFLNQAKKLKGKSFWTPSYTLDHRINGGPVKVISLIRIINDFNSSHPLALLRMSILEETISKIYGNIHPWNQGGIFIVDSAGRIISSKDKSLLGENIKQQPYYSMISSAKSGISSFTLNGKNFFVYYQALTNADWKIVEVIPATIIHQERLVVNLLIGAFIILALAFGFLYLLIQNKSVISPLKVLSKEMSHVQSGNFETSLKPKSNDEIGDVTRSFLNMVNQLKIMIDQVYKSQIEEQKAKLKALESQINPHFLFNSLDSIYWLSVKNKDLAVSEQVAALADMYRHVLDKGKEITTVEQEVNHLKSYVYLQEKRYGERIQVKINVDEKVLICQTPKLILQPLVENAINHGLKMVKSDGRINVEICKKENEITYTVTDNGVGADQEKVKQLLMQEKPSRNSLALRNIQERIHLYYGKEYGLKVVSEKNKGTKVQVAIPFMRAESEDSIDSMMNSLYF